MKGKQLILTLAVSFLGGFCALAVLPHFCPGNAGAGFKVAGNGDVNGDESIDISDAVYLCAYLFRQGPEPVACADSPELVGRVEELEQQIAELLEGSLDGRYVNEGQADSVTADMVSFDYAGGASKGGPALDLECEGCVDESDISFVPVDQVELGDLVVRVETLEARPILPVSATSQELCYDEVGDVIDCVSAEYPGQDGYYQTGLHCHTDNNDGTVTDVCRGLMWQKEADIDGDGQFDVYADVVTWAEALQYCESLILCNDGTWTTDPSEAVTHGGVRYDDWRLPNIRELETLAYNGWSHSDGNYWSSTTAANTNPTFQGSAFIYTFSPYGGISAGIKRGIQVRHVVRAVRGGLTQR